MGSRPALVFDGQDARTDEFCLDARVEPEVPARHGGAAGEGVGAGSARLHAVEADARQCQRPVWRPARVRGHGNVDRIGHAAADEGVGPCASHSRISGVPARMISRRQFVKSGTAAFTIGFAAPAFLSYLARAQGAAGRNLVVLALAGGNDGLSTLVPYTDPFYYSRRPTLAIPSGTVLQVGGDSSGKALGLHPRLTGLRGVFNAGKLAFIQRVGYQNSSRSHF